MIRVRPTKPLAQCRALVETKAAMARLTAAGSVGDCRALARELGISEAAARERRRQLVLRGEGRPGWESQKHEDEDGLTPTRRKVLDVARSLLRAGRAASDRAIAADTGLERSTVRFHRQWLAGRGLWPKEEEPESEDASRPAMTTSRPPIDPSIFRILPSRLRRALDAANVLAAMGVRPWPIPMAMVMGCSRLEASNLIRELTAAGAWCWTEEGPCWAAEGPAASPPMAPAMANPDVPRGYARSAFDPPDVVVRKATAEMLANDRPERFAGRPEQPTLAEVVAGYIAEWKTGKVADLGVVDDEVAEVAA